MPVLFLESREGQCRFPVSDEPNLEMMVCGDLTKKGSSYCPKCHALVYVPASRQRALSAEVMYSRMALASSESADPVDLTEIIR